MVLKILGGICIVIVMFALGMRAGSAMENDNIENYKREAKREYADAVVQDLIKMYGEDKDKDAPVPYEDVINVMVKHMLIDGVKR